MDLSVLESNDPAGLVAEAKQKELFRGEKNFLRTLEEQGYQQTPGSISGADSGQFHIYRKLRRHEIDLNKHYEDELKKEKLDEEFKKQKEVKLKVLEEKMIKKREKRNKRKQKMIGKTVEEKESL